MRPPLSCAGKSGHCRVGSEMSGMEATMASGNGPDEAARRPGLLSFPIHPALVAAYPILYLFARNLGEVDPAEVVGPLLVSIGLAVAIAVGIRLLGVGPHRA